VGAAVDAHRDDRRGHQADTPAAAHAMQIRRERPPLVPPHPAPPFSLGETRAPIVCLLSETRAPIVCVLSEVSSPAGTAPDFEALTRVDRGLPSRRKQPRHRRPAHQRRLGRWETPEGQRILREDGSFGRLRRIDRQRYEER
jgi:hypothetical protein